MIAITNKFNTGFTLIELMVAVAIFGFLAIGVISLVSTVLVGSDEGGRDLASIDSARRVTFEFTSGLRSASYSVTGGYPLQAAEAQNLIFYTDFDQDSDIEQVRYFVSGNSLTRGVTEPTGNPGLYDPTNEKTFLVVKGLVDGSKPIFSYFNDDYEGKGLGEPLAFPVNIADVKYIRMSLNLKKSQKSSSIGTYEVAAGAAIRNLKTNLGE